VNLKVIIHQKSVFFNYIKIFFFKFNFINTQNALSIIIYNTMATAIKKSRYDDNVTVDLTSTNLNDITKELKDAEKEMYY